MKSLVRVVVDHKVKSILKHLTYKVPLSLIDKIEIGSVVKVPFRKKHLFGWVVGYDRKENFNLKKELKEVDEVILKEAFRPDELEGLLEWISSYYGQDFSQSIGTFFPFKLSRLKKKGEAEITSGRHLTEKTQEKSGGFHQSSFEKIQKQILQKKPAVFLMHSYDSEALIELYERCVHACIKQDRQAIIMVPEVFLTPALIERFKEHLFDFSLFHSKMSDKERFGQWMKSSSGKVNVAIGTRSAVFAPFKNLGLIILDQEHDPSYKQETRFRYHARQVAVRRAALNNAVVLLGSSAPSVESYYLAKKGKFHYIFLRGKVDSCEVDLVDIKNRRKNKILSDTLRNNLTDTMQSGRKAVLILNRRGYHTFMACRDCGYIFKCLNCNVSLIYHVKEKKLLCHHCSYQQMPPDTCPGCRGINIKAGGLGTERVEEEIKRLYPEKKVLRMDKDTVNTDYENIYSKFLKADFNILLGTQIIAKGIDFQGVGLAGVIHADTSFSLPDFRSYERTYQLLAQVASKIKNGKFVIQTYDVENPSLIAVKNHDYNYFFNHEISSRKEMRYPPFTHLINCIFSSENKEELEGFIENFFKNIKRGLGGEIDALGPSPCPYEKLNKKYRWHIIFKTENVKKIVSVLKENIDKVKTKEVSIVLDVDPVNLF